MGRGAEASGYNGWKEVRASGLDISIAICSLSTFRKAAYYHSSLVPKACAEAISQRWLPEPSALGQWARRRPLYSSDLWISLIIMFVNVSCIVSANLEALTKGLSGTAQGLVHSTGAADLYCIYNGRILSF